MKQHQNQRGESQLISSLPRRLWVKIALLATLVGPGIITGNYGNDAGGITTYSVAGATYGLGIVWVVLPVVILLYIYQEMSARLAVVTGKGLSDLVRENFGVKFAFYMMIGKFVAGTGNALAECAGIAAAGELFGVSKYISVPVVVMIIWLLVIKANYKKMEIIFLIGVLFYGCYIAAGCLAPLDWREVGHAIINPGDIHFTDDYFILLVALIGTTIAPWMVFYHQSVVVEKGIRISDMHYFRWDTIIACGIVAVVILFIILTCTVLYDKGIKIESAEQAALALEPLAGRYAFVLFSLGLLVASIGAAVILPLSTSFAICETFGWASGISYRFNEAPQFYWIFTLQLFLGAAISLIPGISLVNVMVITQTLNGILLPFVLIPMLILVNKKKIMGAYTNSLFANIIAIITTTAVVVAIGFLFITGLL